MGQSFAKATSKYENISSIGKHFRIFMYFFLYEKKNLEVIYS
jgi:hypothetical protein